MGAVLSLAEMGSGMAVVAVVIGITATVGAGSALFNSKNRESPPTVWADAESTLPRARQVSVPLPGLGDCSVLVVEPKGTVVGTVVMVHGFPDNCLSFSAQVPDITSAGFRVICPTLRGYDPATTSSCGDFGLSAIASDVFTVMDFFQVQHAHLVGHDWGASVVSICTALKPQRVLTLTMIAVPTLFDYGLAIHPHQIRNSWYMMLFQYPVIGEQWLLRFGGLERLYRDWSPTWSPSQARMNSVRRTLEQPGVTQSAIGYYRKNIGGAYLGSAAAYSPVLLLGRLVTPPLMLFIYLITRVVDLPRPPVPTKPKITRPTLAITGAVDGCIATELFDTCMTGCSHLFPAGVQVERIRDAGHWAHVERPEIVTPLILKWILDSPGPAKL